MSYFEKAFMEKGIHITPSRKALFNILEKSNTHLTIDEIYLKAKKTEKTLGIATVYRTLNTLCDLGLIEKHEFPNKEITYEISTQKNHHHHIIDVNSNEVLEFKDENIDLILQKIAKEHGYKMLDHKIEIYGEKIK